MCSKKTLMVLAAFIASSNACAYMNVSGSKHIFYLIKIKITPSLAEDETTDHFVSVQIIGLTHISTHVIYGIPQYTRIE